MDEKKDTATINPTSPHWYSIEHLRGLIAAYVNLEQNGGKVQTVCGFVSEFREASRIKRHDFAPAGKWLFSKLYQIGVTKVVPDEDTLTIAYKRARYVDHINKVIRKESETYDEAVSVPDDLSGREKN